MKFRKSVGPHTPFDREVAKRLDLTPSGLKRLAKAKAGRNVGAGSNMDGAKLIRDGFVTEDGSQLTSKGEHSLAIARKWGW